MFMGLLLTIHLTKSYLVLPTLCLFGFITGSLTFLVFKTVKAAWKMVREWFFG